MGYHISMVNHAEIEDLLATEDVVEALERLDIEEDTEEDAE